MGDHEPGIAFNLEPTLSERHSIQITIDLKFLGQKNIDKGKQTDRPYETHL